MSEIEELLNSHYNNCKNDRLGACLILEKAIIKKFQQKEDRIEELEEALKNLTDSFSIGSTVDQSKVFKEAEKALNKGK